jgi:hypothetical protein
MQEKRKSTGDVLVISYLYTTDVNEDRGQQGELAESVKSFISK